LRSDGTVLTEKCRRGAQGGLKPRWWGKGKKAAIASLEPVLGFFWTPRKGKKKNGKPRKTKQTRE